MVISERNTSMSSDLVELCFFKYNASHLCLVILYLQYTRYSGCCMLEFGERISKFVLFWTRRSTYTFSSKHSECSSMGDADKMILAFMSIHSHIWPWFSYFPPLVFLLLSLTPPFLLLLTSSPVSLQHSRASFWNRRQFKAGISGGSVLCSGLAAFKPRKSS